jgi:hypothetical protein
MDPVIPIIALLLILAIIMGGAGGDISPGAWIEGLILSAILIGGAIAFALYASAHNW